MEIYTNELSPALWNDFQAYFDFQGKSSGCWCMNHRLPMGLNFEGEGARLAMQQLVESGRVFGILAYAKSDTIPVGWCSLDRRRTLPGHDCVGEDIACDKDTWSIHCVTSRSDFRNRGVEEILIEAALDLAQKINAKVLEAYPEPGSHRGNEFKTWNVFNGFESHFTQLGFAPIPKNFGDLDAFFRPMQKTIKTD